MLVGIRLLASAVFGVSRMFHSYFAILLYFEFLSLFLLYFEFLSPFLLYFGKISFFFWNYFAFKELLLRAVFYGKAVFQSCLHPSPIVIFIHVNRGVLVG